MSPSSDVCELCNAPFYGKQKRIYCGGNCGKRFHLSCASGTSVNLGLNGDGAIRCRSCSKDESGADDVATNDVGADIGSITSVLERNLSGDSSVDLVPRHFFAEVLERMKKLERLVIGLTSEVAELRMSNARLEDAVILERSLRPADGKRSYGDVLKTGLSAQPGCDPVGSATAGRVVWPVPINPFLSEPVAASASGNSNGPDRDRTTGEPLQVRQERKKKKKVTGEAVSNNGIGSVSPLRRKAIFVSRLRPETVETELEHYIRGQLSVGHLKCTRLKTKFPSYSSFHVEVNADIYEELFDVHLWPSGCLITEFWGKLKPEQIFESVSQPASADVVLV